MCGTYNYEVGHLFVLCFFDFFSHLSFISTQRPLEKRESERISYKFRRHKQQCSRAWYIFVYLCYTILMCIPAECGYVAYLIRYKISTSLLLLDARTLRIDPIHTLNTRYWYRLPYIIAPLRMKQFYVMSWRKIKIPNKHFCIRFSFH